VGKPKPRRELAERADIEALARQPAFRRFLFRIAQAADMLVATSGSVDRLSSIEGRRSLGFEIFGWVEEALSTGEPSAIPKMTLMAVLPSAADEPPKEAPDEDDDSLDDDDQPRRA
jgi:hypothetical protein